MKEKGKRLMDELNSSEETLLVGAEVGGEYCLRLSLWSGAKFEDIDEFWAQLQKISDRL